MLGAILRDYESGAVNLEKILDFHVGFEKIYPFEDYNRHVGRLIMMRECLRRGIDPFIIGDKRRAAFYRGIEAWDSDQGPLATVTLEAQKDFKAKWSYAGFCNMHVLPAKSKTQPPA